MRLPLWSKSMCLSCDDSWRGIMQRECWNVATYCICKRMLRDKCGVCGCTVKADVWHIRDRTHNTPNWRATAVYFTSSSPAFWHGLQPYASAPMAHSVSGGGELGRELVLLHPASASASPESTWQRASGKAARVSQIPPPARAHQNRSSQQPSPLSHTLQSAEGQAKYLRIFTAEVQGEGGGVKKIVWDLTAN